MDPFEALGLPPRYTLDPADLQRRYLARAAAAHPDLGADDDGEAIASLNTARAILADPLRRAAALLQRIGPAAATPRDELPPGFLQEIMAARLEAEEALEAGDPAARSHWLAWAARHAAEHDRRLRDLFGRDPIPARDIALQLNAWRYIQRFAEQLEEHQPP